MMGLALANPLLGLGRMRATGKDADHLHPQEYLRDHFGTDWKRDLRLARIDDMPTVHCLKIATFKKVRSKSSWKANGHDT